MVQKCILLSIISITLFFALSHIHAEDYDPDINFWPIFYYNKDTDTDEKEVEIFYPIIGWHKDKDARVFCFRPVYSVKKIPKEKYKKSEFLWPLNYTVHTDNRTYTKSFPFYSYTKDTSGKIPEKERTFFPIFFSRTQNGKDKDFAIFPFYGTFHHRFNRDKIQFILWPVYTKVIKGDRHSWNIIWPIFNYAKSTKGDEYGYKVWPFYGKHKKERSFEKGFIMWPLYTYINAEIENVGRYKGWGTIPFYVSEKSPVSDSQSILWPLFNHVDDKQRGLERWDYPFPIATRIKGKERDKNTFLPFWNIDRKRNSKTVSFAYPLFWLLHYKTGNSRKTDTIRFLPFYWKRDEYLIHEGKYTRLRQIWPFYKREKETDHSTNFEVFSLYPFLDDESWERNWKPFFHMYERRNDKTSKRKTTRLLWRLYHTENSERLSYLEMAPFFSLYKNKNNNITCFSLFCNIFQYKKKETDRYIKLLYLVKIPLTLTAKNEKVAIEQKE
ncbi:MAG: hypothetical protein L3J17_04980 [Candidatus Jettenia sp.]|nr:MAG: hypothetical protein L3J17_04980 [Candidatus Jettenia sp.]